MTAELYGIAASDGIAIAKTYRLESPSLEFDKKSIDDPALEIERFHTAIAVSSEELELIKDQAEMQIGPKEAAIFGAHLMVLSDPELIGPITEKIENDLVNAEFALHEVSDMFMNIFASMDNDYMKERAADIKDVRNRVLAHLLGVKFPNPGLISEKVILLADDLTPSDTVQFNPEFIQGFVTEIGGRTSHSAILARTLEIPAVVGVKKLMASLSDETMLIIDGIEGKIIADPTEEQIELYKKRKIDFEDRKTALAALKDAPSVSADGFKVELAANIGSPKDVKSALENGAEAIGLFRTEFLYMGRDSFPTEEQQFEMYSEVLKAMGDKPTVARTLDIGGDKELSYLDLPKELNPFLGLRAIRLCLEMPDLFRTQLRALLRSSVHGNLKIMFPMIATLDEFRQAKQLFLEEQEKLATENIPFNNNIEVGIMVEIPSTAVMADLFAKEVDFFSIGTNDLIQYTMAADRMNENVSHLYQPFNPAILRMVKMVIDAAHKEGKWAGMCGEMAGEELAVPILLGLGLDEFSMSASSILKTRSMISSLSKAEMEKHTDSILALATAEDVKNYVSQLVDK
ncbi:phosphoenolpyruvate--protein phosphotransferase [Planococcus halotolerans]|uniref:Phosphoenolpyruvate-protein phosphotransferase n=1 Tax=Planococcus halotolerans TaxID=2233542 RepID=A0A365L0I2_9BACL|nr:phosphoenolpyruvate--protein phosphotransferase [Planococcus halotolerans]QHJ71296.1 phosphoenolpyruvate--protein phosphotransferase [Planococcus halotolerans]RAZ78943.1 phosphoenolpyruvate--protein phosphotransferase [Planococcus halotolerans]